MSSASASASALEQALVLSRRMHELAGLQEWEQLGALEAQRQALLREIDGALPVDQTVRARLEALLSLNRELEQMCVAARDRVAAALRGQKRNDRAIRSYRAAGGR